MNCSFESWIEHLRQLHEPRGLLHVGAGGGSGMVPYVEWDIEQTLLIEADERSHAALKKNVGSHSGWHTAQVLIDKISGETEFFVASNVAESGLIEPEALAPIWRNLKKTDSQVCASSRLDELVAERQLSCADFNWLLIGCLPAARIIESLGGGIQYLEVIVARVILPQAALDGLEAGLSDLDGYLNHHGFRCLHIEETRTPQIAQVVYVRNMAQRSEISQLEYDEQARLAGERLKQIEQLTQAKAAAEKTAGERAQQLEDASKAKDEQAKLAADRQVEIERLTVDRDLQARVAKKRIQQLELAHKERENLSVLASEIYAAIGQIEVKENCISDHRNIINKCFELREVVGLKALIFGVEDCLGLAVPLPSDLRVDSSGRSLQRDTIKSGGKTFAVCHRPESRGDVGVIKQVFADIQYECGWTPQGKLLDQFYSSTVSSGKSPLIVDAGANIGTSCQWFHSRFPKAKILAIEPDLDNCQLLRYNCSGLPVDLYCGAIADKVRVLKFQDPGQSDWGFRVGVDGDREVSCIGPMELLAYCDANNFDPMIFKIDIEGGEELLFDGDCEWMSRIPVIVIELHDWLLPERNTSINFIKAISKFGFQMYSRGENQFCFNRMLLKNI